MNRRLEGQWAVITGSSSGIGEEYAKQLAQLGANLILVARRKERLEKLSADLSAQYKVQVEVFPADITDAKTCEELVAFATSGGRNVQVLINNAGRGGYGPFLDYSLEEYLHTIDLNIVALTRLTYLFTAHMSRHNLPSYITNVASIAAYVGVPRFGVYTGSKKYVRDLTETLYHEFKNTNLHFCCVSPGGTYTEFLENANQKLKKSGHSNMMTSEEVVSIGMEAMLMKKEAVVTGWKNKLAVFFPRFFPNRWVLAISELAMSGSIDYQKDRLLK